MDSPTADVTHLLRAWSGGDRAALEQLMPLVYDELRRMARHYMQREQPGNTLQATALVNEAFLRLVDVSSVSWQHRPISSPSPLKLCGASWWMRPAPAGPASAEEGW